MARARLTALARWLGPWSSDAHAPRGVEAQTRTLPAAPERPPLRVRLYRGRRPRGSLILWPGLHFAGPDDPRMDRFARILAHAGFVVCAPYLPDFLSLQLQPTVVDDALHVFDWFVDEDRPPGKPGMFSISFGSLPALQVAARRPEAVGGLLVFGGYASWDAAMRFSLTGAPEIPHDPLNRPVVFMNLVEHLPGAPADPTALLDGWRRYMKATWGRAEMKIGGAWKAAARRVGETLPPELQGLFYRGCGLAPGQLEMAEEALARAGDTRGWLDPRPQMGTITCPVHLVHGTDDDVIPYTEAAALEAALPAAAHAGTLLTGLYGHTGHSGLRKIGDLFKEVGTMLRILRAMATLSPDA